MFESDDIIAVSGEQGIKKSALLSLVKERILNPMINFFKSESKQQYADTIIRNQEGKVLLLQRAFTDDFEPGKWCLVGGKIEKDEVPETAAVREVREETNLDILIRPLDTKDKDNAFIYYNEALIVTNVNQPFESLICLNIEEHRGYEWVDPDKIKGYDLILDLGSYIDDLLNKCLPITIKNYRFSNPEEAIAMEGGTGDLDDHWNMIVEGFDKRIVTEEQYLKAHEQYNRLKKAEALITIVKGFDQGLVSEEQYLEVISKSGEGSKGGKVIGHTKSGKAIYESNNGIDHKGNFVSLDKDQQDKNEKFKHHRLLAAYHAGKAMFEANEMRKKDGAVDHDKLSHDLKQSQHHALKAKELHNKKEHGSWIDTIPDSKEAEKYGSEHYAKNN